MTVINSSSEPRKGVGSQRPRWSAMWRNQTWIPSRVRRRCLYASPAGPDSTTTVAPYLRARRWPKSRACRRRSTVLAWESSAWYLGIGGRGGGLPMILEVAGAPGPAKRVGLALVPVADESLDLVLLMVGRAEVPVADDPAVQDREPDLDLVHPRGVLGCVDEVKAAAVAGVESHPAVVPAVVVDVEIVPDHVDLLRRISPCQRFHEVDQRGSRPARQHLSEHLARGDVEGRQQHVGAVPFVLVLVSNGAVVARDVGRMPPLESLHGLLVDADDDRVPGWVEIEVADSLRLWQELRIFAVQPLRYVVGTDLLEAEDPADLAGAEAAPRLGRKHVGQRGVGPHVPEAHDLVIRPLAGQPDQLTTDRQRHRRRPATSRRIAQCLQRGVALEPSLPFPHRARRPADRTRDLLAPLAFMRQQSNSRPLDDQMDVAPPPHELLELAQQVALDVESTWAWSAWHALSIHAALRLFPKPGTNFGLVVLVKRDVGDGEGGRTGAATVGAQRRAQLPLHGDDGARIDRADGTAARERRERHAHG